MSDVPLTFPDSPPVEREVHTSEDDAPPSSPTPPSQATSAQNKNHTVEASWHALLNKVDDYETKMVKIWKEDIAALPVFAGLLSAVVTAFLIESYQWLSESPEDTTVFLLTHISRQLSDPTMPPAEPEAFHPPASSILINCFWFLSLILALVSGLFSLICNHWLREHTRQIPVKTTAEALALYQLRRDSLQKWRVPQLVATMPILLEVALFLFFAGLLHLAWTRNLAVFVVCIVPVGFAAGFYIITALLPIANIYTDIRRRRSEAAQWFRFICPYKSPHAWAVYHFSCMILRQLPSIGPSLYKRGLFWLEVVMPAPDWLYSDLRVLRADPAPFNLKVYKLRALDWAAQMFQGNPTMVPHFQNIFQSLSLHPSIIMSGILNYWTLVMWEDFTPSDVQEELADMTKFQETRRQGLGWYTSTSRAPSIPEPILHSKEGIQILSFHQYWFSLVDKNINVPIVRDLKDSISQFQAAGLSKAVNLRFFIPFPIVDKLWAHPSHEIRQESISLIRLFKDSWSAYPGPEEEGDERLAFIAALIKHLRQNDGNGHQSCLLTSPLGLEFIRFIHNEIIQHRLYEYSGWEPDSHLRDMLIEEWIAATRSVNGLAFIPRPEGSARLSIEVAYHGLDGNAVQVQERPDSVEMSQLGTKPLDP
uniref:DUF6535 domain-containing protein n=1 Tax=Moniliophthora roreri TaxID=221103 RepID=A0A0W0EVX5_MONRR